MNERREIVVRIDVSRMKVELAKALDKAAEIMREQMRLFILKNPPRYSPYVDLPPPEISRRGPKHPKPRPFLSKAVARNRRKLRRIVRRGG